MIVFGVIGPYHEERVTRIRQALVAAAQSCGALSMMAGNYGFLDAVQLRTPLHDGRRHSRG